MSNRIVWPRPSPSLVRSEAAFPRPQSAAASSVLAEARPRAVGLRGEAAARQAGAARASALGALPRLAHVDHPALDLPAVELGDGALSLLVRAHLDEAEAARAVGEPILDDGGGLARPGLREGLLQVGVRRLEGEISYEEFPAHGALRPDGRS